VDGVTHKRAVHQLVAEHFNGPCPDGLEVNHLNGWKSKNWASNLEYATPKQNIDHAWRTGLCGDKAPTPGQHAEIRRLRGLLTQKEMAKRYGLSLDKIKTIFGERTRLRYKQA
jgi:HNH endonuclease